VVGEKVPRSLLFFPVEVAAGPLRHVKISLQNHGFILKKPEPALRVLQFSRTFQKYFLARAVAD